VTYKFHPLADLFPLIEGEEFDALVADIKTNGLLEPVWLYEDKIIDGRNRYLACQALKIEPQTRIYKGKEPIAFVVSLNLVRRQLNTSQKAMLGAKLKAIYQEERPQGKHQVELFPPDASKARDRAGTAVGVNPKYIDMAEWVERDAPEIAETVLKGKIGLTQAHAISEITHKLGRARALKQVIENDLSASATRSMVKEMLGLKSDSIQRQEKSEGGPAVKVEEAIQVLSHNLPRVESATLHTKYVKALKKLVAKEEGRYE